MSQSVTIPDPVWESPAHGLVGLGRWGWYIGIPGERDGPYETKEEAIASRCWECGYDRQVNGGRCFDCRGKSML